MTPTKEQRAEVTRAHREEAYALNEAREGARAKVMGFPYFQHWLSTGEWLNEWPCGSWPALDRFAQALADRDARIGELDQQYLHVMDAMAQQHASCVSHTAQLARLTEAVKLCCEELRLSKGDGNVRAWLERALKEIDDAK